MWGEGTASGSSSTTDDLISTTLPARAVRHSEGTRGKAYWKRRTWWLVRRKSEHGIDQIGARNWIFLHVRDSVSCPPPRRAEGQDREGRRTPSVKTKK